jgi:menaquinone-dependent protoporphyrinogen oxidase
MNLLVVYGSKRGGTAGLADMIVDELVARGVSADAKDAATMPSLDGYDAVVVAGALYAGRWNRAARRFVHRRIDGLRARSVWFVSSGPLDDSASTRLVPPAKQVAKLMTTVEACGHVTFGGRLSPDATGFPAKAMAKTRAGDWRDRDQVRRWVGTVVDHFQAMDTVS